MSFVTIVGVGPKRFSFKFRQRSVAFSDIIAKLREAVNVDKQYRKKLEEAEWRLYGVTNDALRPLWKELTGTIDITENSLITAKWDGKDPTEPDDMDWYDPYETDTPDKVKRRRLECTASTSGTSTMQQNEKTTDPGTSGSSKELGEDNSQRVVQTTDPGTSASSTELGEDNSQRVTSSDFDLDDDQDEDGAQQTVQKLKSKDIDITTFSEPEWSPILQIEINEGRLFLEENQRLVREEVSWHLVKLFGITPPQGVYSKYSKFLLDIPKFKIMREVGTEQYWNGLASKISAYLRTQRALLKKRREHQAANSQAIIPLNELAAKQRSDLEALRRSDLDEKTGKELIKTTFSLRKAMGFEDYKDVLQKEPYLRNPNFLLQEIQNWLDTIQTKEKRQENFDTMITRLDGIFNGSVNTTSEVEKIRLIIKTYEETIPKLHEKKEKPIDLLEVVPSTKYSFQRNGSLPFTITALWVRAKGIRYAVILGAKDIICKVKCSSAQDVIEIWLGAYMALRQPVPSPHLHLHSFLKWALLNVQIPSTIRAPKQKLQLFLRNKYQFVD